MSIQGNWEKHRAEAFSRMGEIDRRTFVRLSGASAAALIFGYGPLRTRLGRRRASPVTLLAWGGLGRPASQRVVLWTRLTPDPLAEDGRGGMPQESVPVQWEVAMDQGFQQIVLSGTELATPELAHTVHVSSATLGVEFVGTSITSGGDGADTSLTQQAILAENPHIRFFNGQRGYVRCRLTPYEWRADYRVLPYVKQRGALLYTRATFGPGWKAGSLARHHAGAARHQNLLEARRVRAREDPVPAGRRISPRQDHAVASSGAAGLGKRRKGSNTTTRPASGRASSGA
jgi:PhoD-like phosphatase, N-terminal domain/PhoD-like phosphatase